jgi:putative addiction module CopG family antidote
VDGKVESGLYRDASDVIRVSLQLLKEHDDMRVKWREQIEQGWLQAQSGELVDGNVAFDKLDDRITAHARKRV